LNVGQLIIDSLGTYLPKLETKLTYHLLQLLLYKIFIDEFKDSKALTNRYNTIYVLQYTLLELAQLRLEKERKLVQTLLRIAALVGCVVLINVLLETV
jgi:hypothetical protein